MTQSFNPDVSRRQIWSATPTPFTMDREVDKESLSRMVEHHVRLGVDGLFLAGTCGEGPWMPDRQKLELVQTVCAQAAGRLRLAVQVTDNSAARVLEQIAVLEGVDFVVVAQPYIAMNTTPESLKKFYGEVLDQSPIPICYYERGKASAVVVPDDVLLAILSHPNLKMIKDSSCDLDRREILLQKRSEREDLALFVGDEFQCVDYLMAGYDGVLFGGSILNAGYVAEMMRLLKNNEVSAAKKVDERMIAMLLAVYGGSKITCWLNGLKTTLVRMGIFSTNRAYLEYPLTPECSAMIDQIIESERTFLLPS